MFGVIKLGKKGDFSAFFQKNRKEEHSAPASKMHIPSLGCKCSVLLVKYTTHKLHISYHLKKSLLTERIICAIMASLWS